MAKIDMKALTAEQIAKAMECKTADELIALAKGEGFELTKDEAEAYMAEMADVELNEKLLQNVAGGICYEWSCEAQYGLPEFQ